MGSSKEPSDELDAHCLLLIPLAMCVFPWRPQGRAKGYFSSYERASSRYAQSDGPNFALFALKTVSSPS